MSTHQIERRRVRTFGRQVELRRVLAICAVLAGVFAVAFGIGHIRRSNEAVVERTPPRMPAVPTPVSSALASAPAIKLAVAKPPPPPKPVKPARSSAATPATQESIVPTSPVTSTPAPAATPTPAPSTPVEPSKPAPAPHPSGGSGGSGGSSGTSFESSG